VGNVINEKAQGECGEQYTEGRQGNPLPKDGLYRWPTRVETTRKQNKIQGYDADKLSHPRILKLDASYAFRTGQHANAKEQNQYGNTKAIGSFAGNDTHEQQQRRNKY